ncbi:MAG TPA: hypothetical protein VJA87_02890 [Candidatus Paceibacterota bacterium]
MDPLARLFGSNTLLKLLRLFLFNDDQSFTVAEAAARTKSPKDSVRREVNLLISAGVIKKRTGKGGSVHAANPKFPHYAALQNFMRATSVIDDADILSALKRTGTLRLVVLSGMFTGAVDTKVDLLVVGDRLEERSLDTAVQKLEAELGRELRFAAFSTEEFRYRVGVYDRLIRDALDYPHKVILDKIGLKEK